MIPASSTRLDRWEERVSATDWDSVRADLDAYGCGLTGPLLTPDEAAQVAALYDDDSRFRSTINMGRHRFGEGEYRYFAEPFPEAVTGLKRALYPRLLPVARDWWTRLGRETPWPASGRAAAPRPATRSMTCRSAPCRPGQARRCASLASRS